MKEINLQELKQLRHRFVEDVNAPIQVLSDPYFINRCRLFNKDFSTLEKYKEFCAMLDEKYSGNVMEFLESYHSMRDKIINDISSSQAFKDFLSDKHIDDLIREQRKGKQYNIKLYTEESIKEGNNCYITFDLKKANFQAISYVYPAILHDADSYEEFIGKYTDNVWAINSKRTREIIFGKLNPNRAMAIERIIIEIIEKYLRQLSSINEHLTLFSVNSDELIYKVNTSNGNALTEIFNKISKEVTEETIKQKTGFDVRIEAFKLKCYFFESLDGKKPQSVYVKEHIDGKKAYKCANIIYFPQTYKLINGYGIDDDDLVFYYDKCELAKFFNPIRLIEK